MNPPGSANPRWRRTIQAPYDAGDAAARRALHDVLRRVMWRNSRHDVADELHLPPQGQTVTWLRPSGIEAHWYKQQRKVCEGAARDALFRIKNPNAAAAARSNGGANNGGAGAAACGGGGGGDITATAAAAGGGVGVGAGASSAAAAARGGGGAAWAAAPGVGRRLGGAADDDDEFRDLIDDGGGDDDNEEEGGAGSADVEMEDAAAATVVDLTTRNSVEEEEEDRYLTPDESRRVLAPLLRLRQACNHPQAGTHGVKGHIGAGGIHSGVIMTMPQIHAVLIERQRTEAEEAQRLVAFTLNASAGRVAIFHVFCSKKTSSKCKENQLMTAS